MATSSRSFFGSRQVRPAPLIALAVSNGDVLGVAIAGSGPFNDVAFLSDGSVILSEQNSAPLRVIDWHGGSYAAPITVPGGAILIESEDSRYVMAQAHVSQWPLYSFNSNTGTWSTLQTNDPYSGPTVTPADSAVGAVSPGGNLVVQGQTLRLYDGSLHQLTDLGETFPYLRDPAGVAFSSDGASLYVATRDGQLVQFDTTTWDVVADISVGAAPADPGRDAASAIGYGDILQISPDAHHVSVIASTGIHDRSERGCRDFHFRS